MELEKKEYRTAIKIFQKSGASSAIIHQQLKLFYGAETSSLATVKRWVKRFREGDTLIEDRQRSGRPKSGNNERNSERVARVIEKDRRLTISEIMKKNKLSYGTVWNIVHLGLGLILLPYIPYTTLYLILYNELFSRNGAICGMTEFSSFLLHDNAPSHTSNLSQSAIKELGFIQLTHPPYSPDLAPSDYFLFPTMKKHLRKKAYHSDAEVERETIRYLRAQDESFYSKGIQALSNRWEKCIKVKGNYVEN